ncbi:MAG: hypothetical protein JWN44_1033 [Myxococcales bacterium]|nr:hypothetical protein [Myxococcales bacterium]
MRVAALAGLVALAVGCVHPPQTRFAEVLRDPSNPHWIELTSRHFILRTDLPPRQARAALVDFEGVYGTLERVAFSGDAPRDRIDVVLFSDEWRFRQIAPAGANGYFMPRQTDDPEPQPTIAIHGRMLIAGTLVEATQRRFRHELTHRFLDHRLRWTPAWLEEGLAEYYSTLKVDGKDATVGSLPNTKILRVDIHLISSLVQGMADDRVDLDQVPTVEELLTADYATFHQPGRELAFYAGAWTFVHMMLNGPHAYAPRFTRFLDMLANGATPPEAWRDCFWGVPLSRLERQFKTYVGRTEMDARAMVVPVPKAARPERERALADDEVHLMLARIRPWDSRENILAAGRELAEARTLAGAHASPELRYWTALYDTRWRRFEDAARELRAAIAVEPGRARYWLALADVLTRDERADAAQLEDAVAHLEPLATSPSALNFVARYYSQKGQVEAGLPFAQRAVAIERGCWECAETLAVLQNLSRAASEPPTDSVYTKPGIY